jgi:hypothetical protein
MLAVAYATGRASPARQVKGDDPDKKGYPGPPGWGLGVGLATPHNKKLIVTEVEQREKLDRFNDDGRKRTKDTKITLATGNVQTVLKPGRMKEMMEEIDKVRVDVADVQEIGWQGQGRIDKKDFSLFYSGPKERTGCYGTGFITSAKMRKSLLSFEPLSDRLCKLRLRGKFRNIILISTYAPTEDSPDAIKDEFYDQLSQECEKARKYDILILLGDFNAKIGRENFIATVAGKYTLHEVTSENGK